MASTDPTPGPHPPRARQRRPEQVDAFRASGVVSSPLNDGTGAWEERLYRCDHVHSSFDAAERCSARIVGSFERFGELPGYATMVQYI